MQNVIDDLSLKLNLLNKTVTMLRADVGFPHATPLRNLNNYKAQFCQKEHAQICSFLQRHNVSDENTACQKCQMKG